MKNWLCALPLALSMQEETRPDNAEITRPKFGKAQSKKSYFLIYLRATYIVTCKDLLDIKETILPKKLQKLYKYRNA